MRVSPWKCICQVKKSFRDIDRIVPQRGCNAYTTRWSSAADGYMFCSFLYDVCASFFFPKNDIGKRKWPDKYITRVGLSFFLLTCRTRSSVLLSSLYVGTMLFLMILLSRVEVYILMRWIKFFFGLLVCAFSSLESTSYYRVIICLCFLLKSFVAFQSLHCAESFSVK